MKCQYRLPAEWEPQEFVLLTWPHAGTDWAPYLDDITRTMTLIAREIARREEVVIVAPQQELVPEELRQLERVQVVEMPTNDTWARDHGPIVLLPEQRGEGRGARVAVARLPLQRLGREVRGGVGQYDSAKAVVAAKRRRCLRL